MIHGAQVYLNLALDYIQENAVMSAQIDWPVLRQQISVRTAQAQTSAETYQEIESVLTLLGDHHSHFRSPASVRLLQEGQAKQFGLRIVIPEGIVALVFPGSPAELAGIHVGDQVETLNGQPIKHLSIWQLRATLVLGNAQQELTLTLKPAGGLPERSVCLQAGAYDTFRQVQGSQIEPTIGYLDLPGLTGSPQQEKDYAQMVQQLIREIDQSSPSGWIIDLRRNTGGNMWPMVAGVGPILGEGEWMVFATDFEKTMAFYRNGQAGVGPDYVLAEVSNPYQLKRPNPPVAVLTSQLTASSGEFTALAFCGRAHTRIFGEPTQGVPTANHSTMLSDGAMIILTTALGADRAGRIYNSSLLPDHTIKIDWLQLSTPDDPVMQTAVQWLKAEEG